MSKQAVNPVYPAKDYGLVRETSESTHYAGDVLNGNFAKSLLNQAFLSDKNIDIIQNAIRYQVWSQTQQMISKQSATELMIVMRSTYLQHGRNLPYDIPQQIQELNDIVVQDRVPKIISNLTQYNAYLHDVNSPLNPIPRAIDTSSTGTKGLRSLTSTF